MLWDRTSTEQRFRTGEPGSGGPPYRETVVGRPRRRALVSWTGGMGQRCCTPSTPTTKGVQSQFRRSVTRWPGSWASRGTSPSVAARSGGGTGPRWLRFSPLSEPRTGLACQANAFAITGESRRRSDCGPRCSQYRRRSLDVGVVLSPGRRLARGRKPGRDPADAVPPGVLRTGILAGQIGVGNLHLTELFPVYVSHAICRCRCWGADGGGRDQRTGTICRGYTLSVAAELAGFDWPLGCGRTSGTGCSSRPAPPAVPGGSARTTFAGSAGSANWSVTKST